MDEVEGEERDAVFNKQRSVLVCVLGFAVTACLSPFGSHKDHMETFIWLKADQCMLSRACNICYLFSRSALIKFSKKYRQLQRTALVKWNSLWKVVSLLKGNRTYDAWYEWWGMSQIEWFKQIRSTGDRREGKTIYNKKQHLALCDSTGR